MTKHTDRPPRSSDPNERAHGIVAEATAEPPPTRAETLEALTRIRARAGRDPDALCDVEIVSAWVAVASEPGEVGAALGRQGGLKGGRARAASLSPEQRSEIASVAASARWKKTHER